MSEEKLFKIIMKVHGLIPCEEEEEYIEALQCLLDYNIGFDTSEFMNDILNMYLAEKKIHIRPEKIN